VRPDGDLVFNSITLALDMALAGLGLALPPDDMAAAHPKTGRLARVLTDWRPKVSGYLLYYPSRRRHALAFAILVDAHRYRPGRASTR
jgi:DNA-binding transcriptional LysR family regulator